jgi:hypothetical protein
VAGWCPTAAGVLHL